MPSRRKFLKRVFSGVAMGTMANGLFAKVSRLSKMGLEFDRTELQSPPELTWAEIRAEFNVFDEYHYLNAATLGLTSQRARQAVIQQVDERISKGQYWLQPDARKAVARMLNVQKNEIAVTQNTTQGINIVAQGLQLKKRDEIIISNHEHVGGALPWLNRARRDGIRLRVFELADTAAENLNRIAALVNRRSRVIAVPHLTCTTGQVLPVQEIAQLARDRGLLSFVDGAHGAGAGPLDLKAMGCDFYAGCGHKWLCGPAGTGFLYVREERLEEVEPIMVGAYSGNGWQLDPENQSLDGFAEGTNRFIFGTQNAALHAGLAAGIEFMEAIGWGRIRDRHEVMHRYLRGQLEALPGIEILSPEEAKSTGAMVAFRFPDLDFKALKNHIGKERVRIRAVHESGLNSFRVAPHVYTRFEDLDAVAEAMKTFKP